MYLCYLVLSIRPLLLFEDGPTAWAIRVGPSRHALDITMASPYQSHSTAIGMSGPAPKLRFEIQIYSDRHFSLRRRSEGGMDGTAEIPIHAPQKGCLRFWTQPWASQAPCAH